MPKKACDYPFQVRQTVNTMGNEQSVSIKGFANEKDAQVNCDDRNARAEKMELKARYEVVPKSKAVAL